MYLRFTLWQFYYSNSGWFTIRIFLCHFLSLSLFSLMMFRLGVYSWPFPWGISSGFSVCYIGFGLFPQPLPPCLRSILPDPPQGKEGSCCCRRDPAVFGVGRGLQLPKCWQTHQPTNNSTPPELHPFDPFYFPWLADSASIRSRRH